MEVKFRDEGPPISKTSVPPEPIRNGTDDARKSGSVSMSGLVRIETT